MLGLQTQLQDLIVNYIKTLSAEDRKRDSILTPDNTEQIIVLHNENKVLVLIDIPLEQSSDDTKLEYLPESSRHNVKEIWLKPAKLEDSTFWTQLNKDLTKYVGKVRVFAHPDIADVLAAAIEQDELEKLVERAMQFVIEGGKKKKKLLP